MSGVDLTGPDSSFDSGASTPIDGLPSGAPKRGKRTPRFSMTPMPESNYHSAAEDDEDGDASWSEGNDSDGSSPPPAMTPTFSESYTNLRKNLSFATLRELELQTVRKQVWRKKEEVPRLRPRDIEQVVVHAGTAAARAFLLAYYVRSGVNLATTLLRLLQRRKFKTAAVLHAVFGEEPIRFGTMFGAYVFIWKTALHLLRIYNPGRKGKRRTEYWHAPLAGALSGLAILAERSKNRVGIAQQLFVRGLQGWYNILHKNGHVSIPHGDILLFGLSCGQIMYAWLVSPDSLPPGYSRWITGASRVPPPIRPWVHARQKFSDQVPPLDEAYKILTRKDITPANFTKVNAIIENAQNGDFGGTFPLCEMVHPWADSCRYTQLLRFRDVFSYMMPAYAALHFIPPILFRQKQFLRDPLAMLLRSFKGTLRSCTFISTFVVIFQSLVCLRHQTWWFGKNLPGPIRKAWLSKYYYWVLGSLTCLSLFIEEKKRRGELAMYVMPKALESAWNIARRRAYVPFIPGGTVLLNCAALSMVMSTYQHEPSMLSGLVRTLVFQFVGLD